MLGVHVRVFMLGWEFPPVVSGGLGVACYGLAKALNGMGVDVMFVLPKPLASPTNGHGSHSQDWRRSTRLVHTREVHAATDSEVQHAVEQAAAHAAATEATDRSPPVSGPVETTGETKRGVREGCAGGEHAPTIELAGVQETQEVDESQSLERVTFVPVDVLLTPYMTPGQYQRMVVEEWKGGGGCAGGERGGNGAGCMGGEGHRGAS